LRGRLLADFDVVGTQSQRADKEEKRRGQRQVPPQGRPGCHLGWRDRDPRHDPPLQLGRRWDRVGIGFAHAPNSLLELEIGRHQTATSLAWAAANRPRRLARARWTSTRPLTDGNPRTRAVPADDW